MRRDTDVIREKKSSNTFKVKRQGFEIRINLRNSKLHEKKSGDFIYHEQGEITYVDKVNFSKDKILIRGERTKININKTIDNTNTSFYRVIIKSLLYYYFSFGSFDILSIEMKIIGTDLRIKKENFNQRYSIRENVNLPRIIIEGLKKKRKISNALMNSLVYYNLSLNSSDFSFENLWRSFNSVSEIATGEKRDRSQIDRFHVLVSQNSYKFTKSIMHANRIYEKRNIVGLRFFINYYRNNSIGGIKEKLKSIQEYKDYRVCSTLVDYLEMNIKVAKDKSKVHTKEKKKNKLDDFELNKEKLKKSILEFKSTMKSQAEKNEVVDTDLLKFYFEFIYFLRNKYIHANMMDWNYLFFTKEKETIDDMRILLDSLIIDFIKLWLET